MKKKLLFTRALLTTIVVFSVFTLNSQTFTDVTSSYLFNTDFDTSPTYIASDGTATSSLVASTLGYDIPNWSELNVGVGSYSRFCTANYGITFVTKPDVLNAVNPPTVDKNGGTSGASLMMSGAWTSTVILTQDVTLPAGKYKLKFEVLNQNGTNAIGANRFGFVPSTGGTSFYGTKTNYGTTWVNDSVMFTVTQQTAGKISVGFVGRNVGSSTSAKLAVDNIKLYYYVDKSILTNKLAEAKAYKSNGIGLASYITSINDAQIVNDNASATDTEVTNAINSLQTAIDTYLTNNAVDQTSLIVNPSMENATALFGWTNTGTMARQSNVPGTGWTKDLTYYAEKWIASGSNLPAAELKQTVTGLSNGVYRMTVSAHAIQQSNLNLVTTGASVFAGGASTNVNIGNNYTVYNIIVTNGTLDIGFRVAAPITCNWIGYDNFKLYYLGTTIDPVISTSLSTASLTTTTNSSTFDVTGANLTSDITITVPSTHITLSGTNVTGTSPNYTIALANANATNAITATWDIAANVSGNISFTSGAATKTVAISTDDVESASLSNITSNVGVLSPSFSVGTTTYSVKVPVDVTSATISGTTTSTLATVTNNNTDISSSTTSVILTGNSYNGAVHTADYTVTWDGNYTFADWDANGITGVNSMPTYYGWVATPTLTWMAANTTSPGTVRYMDMVSGSNAGISGITYVYNAVNYDGRIMFARWDGANLARVYSYPAYVEAGKTYKVTGKAAWNSNGSAPTLTFKINTAKDNTGTEIASTTAVTGTAGNLVDVLINTFSVPTTGIYYLTVASSTESLCAIADLTLLEGPFTSVDKLNNTMKIYTVGRSLYVVGADSYKVYNIQGVKVAEVSNNTSNTKVDLNQGAYIVKSNNGVQKFIVK